MQTANITAIDTMTTLMVSFILVLLDTKLYAINGTTPSENPIIISSGIEQV